MRTLLIDMLDNGIIIEPSIGPWASPKVGGGGGGYRFRLNQSCRCKSLVYLNIIIIIEIAAVMNMNNLAGPLVYYYDVGHFHAAIFEYTRALHDSGTT